jgi:hypothetical protein
MMVPEFNEILVWAAAAVVVGLAVGLLVVGVLFVVMT